MHIRLERARRLNDEGTRPQASSTPDSDEFLSRTLLLQDKYAVLPLRDWVCDKHHMRKEWNETFVVFFLGHLCSASTTFSAPFGHEPEAFQASAAGGSRCTNSVVLMPVSGKRWLVCNCLTCRSPLSWFPFKTESGWLCCCISGHPNQRVPLEWFLPEFPPCCRTITPRRIL